MEIPAVQSLTALQAAIYMKKDNLTIAYANGFNAAKARVYLSHYAVQQKDFDYILWLDSDHIYSSVAMYSMIEKMCTHGLEMLSAKYYVRDANLQKQTAHGNFSPEGFKKFSEPIDGEIIDCDVLGFGFLLMRPEFLKKMVDTYNKDLFKFDIDQNSTEDVYFCRQAKKLGTRVCFDNKNTIGHITSVVNG
jgi:hypothetical protein